MHLLQYIWVEVAVPEQSKLNIHTFLAKQLNLC